MMFYQEITNQCILHFIMNVTNLLGKQTMHNEERHPFKAAKDGEVRHGCMVFFKLDTTKDPHAAQHKQLSHCSNGECPVGNNKTWKNRTTNAPKHKQDKGKQRPGNTGNTGNIKGIIKSKKEQ